MSLTLPSAIQFFVFAAYAIIFGFAWRNGQNALARSKNPTLQQIGAGMSTIF